MYGVSILLIVVTEKKFYLGSKSDRAVLFYGVAKAHTRTRTRTRTRARAHCCSMTIFRGAGLHCCVCHEAMRQGFSSSKVFGVLQWF
jgi:hypothetical protein